MGLHVTRPRGICRAFWYGEVEQTVRVWIKRHPLDQWRKIRGRVGASQVKPSNCFRRLEKIGFRFHFWHKSFTLHDVKLAELSDNSFECGILGRGSKTHSDASYIFSWPPWSTSPARSSNRGRYHGITLTRLGWSYKRCIIMWPLQQLHTGRRVRETYGGCLLIHYGSPDREVNTMRTTAISLNHGHDAGDSCLSCEFRVTNLSATRRSGTRLVSLFIFRRRTQWVKKTGPN